MDRVRLYRSVHDGDDSCDTGLFIILCLLEGRSGPVRKFSDPYTGPHPLPLRGVSDLDQEGVQVDYDFLPTTPDGTKGVDVLLEMSTPRTRGLRSGFVLL